MRFILFLYIVCFLRRKFCIESTYKCIASLECQSNKMGELKI